MNGSELKTYLKGSILDSGVDPLRLLTLLFSGNEQSNNTNFGINFFAGKRLKGFTLAKIRFACCFTLIFD